MTGEHLLDQLQPGLRLWARWLFQVAKDNGLAPRVTSTYRSPMRQQRLYNRYLTLRGRGFSDQEIGERFGLWTPLPPGRSLHNYRLAFDIVTRNNAALGQLWRRYGGYWAGPGDPVHFSVARSVDDLIRSV